jgi:hypothetical protein
VRVLCGKPRPPGSAGPPPPSASPTFRPQCGAGSLGAFSQRPRGRPRRWPAMKAPSRICLLGRPRPLRPRRTSMELTAHPAGRPWPYAAGSWCPEPIVGRHLGK